MFDMEMTVCGGNSMQHDFCRFLTVVVAAVAAALFCYFDDLTDYVNMQSDQ